MRLFNLFVTAIAALSFVACDFGEEQQQQTTYPEITQIEGTSWSGTEQNNGEYTFYTLSFEDASTGSLVGYNAKENGEEVSRETFTYTFTKPAVSITFSQSGKFDGYIVPKGQITVDYKDVYILQLFHVDNDGKPTMNDKGEYEKTMMFWCE